MTFDVDFYGHESITVNAEETFTDICIRVPIGTIAKLLHDICDDFCMVNPYYKEELQEAIDRFNYLTKVED